MNTVPQVFLVIYNAFGGGSGTLGIYGKPEKANEHAEFLREMIRKGSIITRPQDTVKVEPWNVQ